MAHEFFHLWNVKRIRPDALGPFDYTKENYTRNCFGSRKASPIITPGWSLRRAGFISDQGFLQETAKAIQELQKTPGRLVQSAEESSFDAWIKYYRQDENSVNSQISYYDKGAILGLLLDLEIRKRTAVQSRSTTSCDISTSSFTRRTATIRRQDFQKACELMAGASLEHFFASYVRGREELDYNCALAAAGLRLDTAGASESAVILKPGLIWAPIWPKNKID